MGLIGQWRAMRQVRSLPPERRRIVFYSEEPGHWVHLEPMIRHLVDEHDQTVCYLCSAPDDPGLTQEHPRILAFEIGEGTVRTALFRTLRAGVMVLTMPELDCYAVKRSVNPVHYCYVHHSLVSTHMVYRPAAFDHFDSIFCAGPHHEEEVRRTEELYGLRRKSLYRHGYGRLDSILAQARAGTKAEAGGSEHPHVLIAPSWGPTCIVETIGRPLVEVLLRAGYRVTLRPHPQTRRMNPRRVDSLVAKFGQHPRFRCEADVVSQESLHASDLMISDWSGAALDYALGLERPVLFLDVPRKVNNPDFARLDIVPFEDRIRRDIGAVVAPDRLDDIPDCVQPLISDPHRFRARIGVVRSRWVYNVGSSGARGAERILELAAESERPCQDTRSRG